MSTKIYSFDCKSPRGEMLKMLNEQFFLAHKYYNDLVKLELLERTEIRAAQSQFSEALTRLQGDRERLMAEKEELRSQLKRSKAHGAAPVDTSAIRQRIRDINAGLKLQWAAIVAIKAQLKSSVVLTDRLREINERFSVLKKQVYADSPLFWGTKNHVAQRIELAKKGGDPKFRKWSRDGIIYCQIQGGIDPGDVLACDDNRVQIERLPRGKRSAEMTGKVGELHPKLCKVRMRVGSSPDSTRVPIWAELITYVHRQFPANSTIMGVQIVRKGRTFFREQIVPGDTAKYSRGKEHNRYVGRYDYRDDYAIQFTLRIADPEPSQLPASPRALAIDLGWRIKPDGWLRVGQWKDTVGKSGEFLLSPDLLGRWLKSRSIQSIRDKNFNMAIAALRCYLDTAEVVPDSLKEIKPHLHNWKSLARLSILVARWEWHPGDEGIYSTLTAWRDREMHLQQYQIFNEKKAQAIRKDLFRNWAAKLRTSHDVIIMEKMNIAEMRTKAPVEAESEEFYAIFWRNAAAIGLLRQTIANSGCRVVLRPAANTTITCHHCNAVNTWNRAVLMHRCSECNRLWDQDVNAAENLLKEWLNNREEEKSNNEPKKGRWQRRKEAKQIASGEALKSL
jgi:Putative transposase DNA-binding domain